MFHSVCSTHVHFRRKWGALPSLCSFGRELLNECSRKVPERHCVFDSNDLSCVWFPMTLWAGVYQRQLKQCLVFEKEYR